MMESGINLVVSGTKDEEGGVLDSFLLLKLTELDTGRIDDGRKDVPAFRNRTPWCIRDMTRDGLILVVDNLGPLASDLVYIDYQVRYCTVDRHGPSDGFVREHAEDEIPDEMDRFLTASTVPAQDFLAFQIPFRNVRDGVRNIYFRAKVTSLMERRLPPWEWNFVEDRMVTEAHLRLP